MHSTDDEPWLDLASVKQPAKKALLEKQIEKKVCDRAERCGWRSLKFVSPNYRSVPDRIFFKHPGRVFFIEFKKRGEVPTPKQEAEMARLRAEGFDVFVCDDVEFGYTIIELMS
jgi:hypothetical protein